MIWLLVHQGWEVWSKAREENGKNRQMGLCESLERSPWNVGWLHELEQSFLVKKSRFLDGASFVLHNASASEICRYCDNTHYVYLSSHLHLRLHHLKHKLPFAISSLLCRSQTLDQDRIVVPPGWDSWGKISVMRDGFDAKIWGEAWERDLESANRKLAKQEQRRLTLHSFLISDLK